jgi:hypothetical protein
MGRKSKKSAEYWREVIKDFFLSGLSQEQYVREHNICRATLFSWSKRLEIPLSRQRTSPKVQKETSLSFIEVNPPDNCFKAVSIPLKVEILFPQGHTIKLETEGTFAEAGAFIKTLVG